MRIVIIILTTILYSFMITPVIFLLLFHLRLRILTTSTFIFRLKKYKFEILKILFKKEKTQQGKNKIIPHKNISSKSKINSIKDSITILNQKSLKKIKSQRFQGQIEEISQSIIKTHITI